MRIPGTSARSARSARMIGSGLSTMPADRRRTACRRPGGAGRWCGRAGRGRAARQRPLQRAADHADAERPGEDGGEDGEDVEAHHSSSSGHGVTTTTPAATSTRTHPLAHQRVAPLAGAGADHEHVAGGLLLDVAHHAESSPPSGDGAQPDQLPDEPLVVAAARAPATAARRGSRRSSVAASSRLGSSSNASSISSPSSGARRRARSAGAGPRSPSSAVPGAKRPRSPPSICTRTSPRTPWTRRTWATRSSGGAA